MLPTLIRPSRPGRHLDLGRLVNKVLRELYKAPDIVGVVRSTRLRWLGVRDSTCAKKSKKLNVEEGAEEKAERN